MQAQRLASAVIPLMGLWTSASHSGLPFLVMWAEVPFFLSHYVVEWLESDIVDWLVVVLDLHPSPILVWLFGANSAKGVPS